MNPPNAKQCCFCSQPVTVHFSRTCDAPHCRFAMQQHLLRRQKTCRICGRPIAESCRTQVTCESSDCRIQYARFSRKTDDATLWCVVCNALLVHNRPGTQHCGDRECERVFANRLATERQEKKQRKNALIRESALAVRDRVAQQSANPTTVAELPVATVPHTQAKLTVPNPQRIAAFHQNLSRVIDAALDDSDSGVDATRSSADYHDEPSPKEDPVFRNCCRLCRGFCCEAGGTTAFISPILIRQLKDQAPELGREDLLALYMSYLPERSLENSCVYHGDRGCNLPRNMRSELCNRFLCGYLLSIRNTLADAAEDKLFVAAVSEIDIIQHEIIDVPAE